MLPGASDGPPKASEQAAANAITIAAVAHLDVIKIDPTRPEVGDAYICTGVAMFNARA